MDEETSSMDGRNQFFARLSAADFTETTRVRRLPDGKRSVWLERSDGSGAFIDEPEDWPRAKWLGILNAFLKRHGCV